VKTSRKASPTAPPLLLVELRQRLNEAEDALHAIRNGEVDAVVGTGRKGNQVFTLEGADHAYRVLIESMNEGALTLTSGTMILYANQCFARMVKAPLESVIGSSFRRFLSEDDQLTLQATPKERERSGAKFQALLTADDGTRLPVQISIRPQIGGGLGAATIGMVVTDMTEARRTEELLRALTNRVVQVQESERERVSFELHDNITQLLCAVVFRSQALVESLSVSGGPQKRAAARLRDMLGKVADEVVRISHNLGPTSLDHVGLVSVLRETKTEFADRTGVSTKLTCLQLTARLPANTELALYRILQEALRNIEKHAKARHVTVHLSQQGAFVRLAIHDDGVGFDTGRKAVSRKGKAGLGLLSMRERASYVGGTLEIRSNARAGTDIDVLIPMAPR
jgi:two-component system NarL family sensor kinase